MDLKVLSGIVLVSLGIGGFIGYKVTKGAIKPEVKTEVKEVSVDKIITKVVTKEITRPDGTKEVVTVTDRDEKVVKTNTNTIIVDKNKWIATIDVSKSFRDLTEKEVYGLNVSRRIIGDVFVGGRVTTNRDVGVVIGVQF